MNLWRVYIRTYGLRMMTAGMFKLTADMLQFVGPLCISGIVNFVTAGEKQVLQRCFLWHESIISEQLVP